MDPAANMKEQLELAREIQAIEDDSNADGTFTNDQKDRLVECATRLAELVIAFDGWIKKGGFGSPIGFQEKTK